MGKSILLEAVDEAVSHEMCHLYEVFTELRGEAPVHGLEVRLILAFNGTEATFHVSTNGDLTAMDQYVHGYVEATVFPDTDAVEMASDLVSCLRHSIDHREASI